MLSGWPPDGWYPVGFYREDLETRDELEKAAQQLPNVISERFTDALAKVDDKFRSATLDADSEETAAATLGLSKIDLTLKRGWWWRRLPDPPPWSDAS
jgi:hypothetical protein